MAEKERIIKTAREYPLGCGFLTKVLFTLGLYLIWWRVKCLTVTTRRVIWRTGVIAKNERTIPLSRVQDVTVKYSVFGRIFRYGDVRIESAGGATTEIVANGVGDPSGVQRAILDHLA